jgi:hypothetical protein
MGVKSIPSRIIYSIDVPEVTSLNAKFKYNYYVPNESIRDKDILTDDAIKNMNISQNIISKPKSEIAEKYLDYAEKRFPRYVEIKFLKPLSVDHAQPIPDLIKNNIDKIVDEEHFASNYYTALNFSNGHIDKSSAEIFDESSKINSYSSQTKQGSAVSSYTNIKQKIGSSNIEVISNILNQQELIKGTIFRSGEGSKRINTYFDSIKKLSVYSQVSNNVLLDLAATASSEEINTQGETFKKVVKNARNLVRSNNNFDLSDEEFKPSIPYYKIVTSNVDASAPSRSSLIGYVIEKFELFEDGTQKKLEPLIIENPGASSYIDTEIRYGAVYVYKVKTIMDVTVPAIDNASGNMSMISSLVSSKPVTVSVETTENLGPPPPTGLKFVWDYDRVNPSTTLFDPISNKPYPNTGTRGSLMLYWQFPVNPQMDIKKFQVFRRLKVTDPFELIKVFDFNDSQLVFPDPEDSINQKLVEKLPQPECSYYDDDFLKNSEYIYAVAAIDAHGLTSNYSEQFKVSFDVFKNQIKTSLVSIAGAPKQYPNLYLQQDLFLDSIKTSNKMTMHVYLTPDCYDVVNGQGQITNALNPSSRGSTYKLNFINIENQLSTQFSININDLRSKKTTLKVSSNNFNLKK